MDRINCRPCIKLRPLTTILAFILGYRRLSYLLGRTVKPSLCYFSPDEAALPASQQLDSEKTQRRPR